MLKIKKNLNKMPELLKKFHNQEEKQLSMNNMKKDKMKMFMEEVSVIIWIIFVFVLGKRSFWFLSK